MAHPDYWYDKWMASTQSNACVVRVTNQCNQKCRHCCFRSGPEHVGQMSVKMCEKINAWVPVRVALNIMGGEFSVLDNYPEMLAALSRDKNIVHLVTNGFWTNDKEGIYKFFSAIRGIKRTSECVSVTVSNDHWHKKSTDDLIKILKNNGLDVTIETARNLGPKGDRISPIGRAWDNKLVPCNSIHCSCEVMSSMIITEDGMVNRCPYGYFPWKHFSETTWNEAQEYIWGWRSEKLSEGMNCHLCMEVDNANRCRFVSNKTSLAGELSNV
ncbi:hypothetical protein LCGC14_0220790 [marine sediment metagenome]|uniref:Radical SAM core domain-containing protein n=1 Tax=marine sediment metagenome TaxID=412755 RepID=A0A0F9WXP6_9ZZZZ